MPKTKYEYELDILLAFRHGMSMKYGVNHENIHEDEKEFVIKFASDFGFKTEVVKNYYRLSIHKMIKGEKQ